VPLPGSFGVAQREQCGERFSDEVPVLVVAGDRERGHRDPCGHSVVALPSGHGVLVQSGGLQVVDDHVSGVEHVDQVLHVVVGQHPADPAGCKGVVHFSRLRTFCTALTAIWMMIQVNPIATIASPNSVSIPSIFPPRSVYDHCTTTQPLTVVIGSTSRRRVPGDGLGRQRYGRAPCLYSALPSPPGTCGKPPGSLLLLGVGRLLCCEVVPRPLSAVPEVTAADRVARPRQTLGGVARVSPLGFCACGGGERVGGHVSST